jgi:O-antigen/teichoic acid export membrane protein
LPPDDSAKSPGSPPLAQHWWLRLGRSPATGALSLTLSAAWILLGRVISFAIATALPLLLVRRLDRPAYGLYKMIFQVVTTAANVFPLGFAMNTYYFLPREQSKQAETVFNTLLVLLASGMLGCAVLIAWPGLLVFLANGTEVIPYSPFVGILVLLTIVGTLLEIVLIASQEMQLASGVIIFGQVLRTMLLLAAAIFFTSVTYLVWAAIVYGCLQVLALFAYVSLRFPRFWTRFDRRLLREQLSYALPLGFVGLI